LNSLLEILNNDISKDDKNIEGVNISDEEIDDNSGR
jgi:hypothetical protein